MKKLLLLTTLLVGNYAIATTETRIKNDSQDTIYVCGKFNGLTSPDNFKVLKNGESVIGKNVEHIAITNSDFSEKYLNAESCNTWLQKGAKANSYGANFFWNDLWVGKDEHLDANHMSEITVGYEGLFNVTTGLLYNNVKK